MPGQAVPSQTFRYEPPLLASTAEMVKVRVNTSLFGFLEAYAVIFDGELPVQESVGGADG